MTMHRIEEFTPDKMMDCILMAKKMAMATIHCIYDDHMDDTDLTMHDLERVEEALKILTHTVNVK